MLHINKAQVCPKYVKKPLEYIVVDDFGYIMPGQKQRKS